MRSQRGKTSQWPYNDLKQCLLPDKLRQNWSINVTKPLMSIMMVLRESYKEEMTKTHLHDQSTCMLSKADTRPKQWSKNNSLSSTAQLWGPPLRGVSQNEEASITDKQGSSPTWGFPAQSPRHPPSMADTSTCPLSPTNVTSATPTSW